LEHGQMKDRGCEVWPLMNGRSLTFGSGCSWGAICFFFYNYNWLSIMIRFGINTYICIHRYDEWMKDSFF
jgi:hypothetical protein